MIKDFFDIFSLPTMSVYMNINIKALHDAQLEWKNLEYCKNIEKLQFINISELKTELKYKNSYNTNAIEEEVLYNYAKNNYKKRTEIFKLLHNLVTEYKVDNAIKGVNLSKQFSYYKECIYLIDKIEILRSNTNCSYIHFIDNGSKINNLMYSIPQSEFLDENYEIIVYRSAYYLDLTIDLGTFLGFNNIITNNIKFPYYSLIYSHNINLPAIMSSVSICIENIMKQKNINSNIKDILLSIILGENGFILNKFKDSYIFVVPNFYSVFEVVYNFTDKKGNTITFPKYYHPIYLASYRVGYSQLIENNVQNIIKNNVSQFPIITITQKINK